MSALIAAADLAARLGAPGLTVLDVRSGPEGRTTFAAGHVPGARLTDYAADGWRRSVGGAPGVLPTAGHLSALFARLGLAPGRSVVVAPEGRSANDFAAAARVFWTLRVAGFASLAMLDGGTAGWIGEGRPVETGEAAGEALPPAPVAFDDAHRATAEDVLAALKGGAALVDARAPAYFRGEEKAAQAKAFGHIPGAVNVDYVTAFDPAQGRLKPRPALAALFSAAPAGPVVSYCNTGHTAALDWFVLAEVLGRPARLYDGSMTDWTQDTARPVARSG